MWRIDDEAEIERLELKQNVQPNVVMVVEWSQKVATYLQKVVAQTGATFVEVNISEVGKGRELEVKEI